MPHDQHGNPAEEPSSALLPGVTRAPSARVRIQTQVKRIGRHPGNDIVVNDLGVSKQHAELRRSPTGRCLIIDLGSHRGTFVNGTRVRQQELNEGDIIVIGQATFQLAGRELIEYVDAGTAGAGTEAERRVDLPVPVRPATPGE
jgi:pSer/pThr/pTyr-binding forkhead associated (FHA) protein